MEFIDNLSGGNTRRVLDFVTAFIGSAHVNAEKILNIAEESGRYTIPVHEFMRAVVFGDFEHYEPGASPIANLFDISTPDGREHFLLGNALAFIERSGDATGNEGFVEAGRIHEFCQSLGFTPMQIEFGLRRAAMKKLIDSSPMFTEGQPSMYRITSAGAYTYKELPKYFAYVDAIIVDTPIVDPKARATIGNSQTIGERLDRMEVFRDYLHSQYMPLASKAVAFDWATLNQMLGLQVERVRKAQKRPT